VQLARLRGRARGRIEHDARVDDMQIPNRRTLQKARELAHLQRFCQNFAGFPEGELISSEYPDFLVITHQGRTGIELTEYHVQESDEGRGSRMRAQERTEDKVLWTASDQHESKGLPPVAVYVLWNPHWAFNRRRIQELAAVLADLVQEHLPELGHEVAIRRGHSAWRSLPQEVASLSVDRRINFSKNSWTSVRAAFVPTLTPPELQKIMRDKEAKVPSYRQECQEAWLLIVAHGFEPSTFGELGPEVKDHEFETSFDRVFFLHHADDYVAELHVRPSDSEY
jgi:hypothetical protein